VSAPLVQRVFQSLSSAEFQSGEALAERLQVTRAAVWKAVEQLRELSIEPEAQPNRGYRLPQGIDALSAAEIRASMPADVDARVEDLTVLWSTESTNDSLLATQPVAPNKARVVLAELQTAGRGRRGRSWMMAPGGAICLSIGWSFAEMPRDLSALTLAVGVCVQRALATCGAPQVKLKWPNDLVTNDGKLGGILLELRAEAGGPVYVVIGIGINVSLPAAVRAAVAKAGGIPVDYRAVAAAPVSRNVLVAHIVEECMHGLTLFRESGFAAFHTAWNELDALRGRAITVQSVAESSVGFARGVDAHGQLLVENAGALAAHASGEVLVRPIGAPQNQ
jgi:BirA family transcriptional regulator, biotin operon repressor / biotin---[acetyl-CoA-carboxylase] ligase